MRPNLRSLFALVVLLIGGLTTGLHPAAALDGPVVHVDPLSGPAGTTIVVTDDGSGGCWGDGNGTEEPFGGNVLVTFGILHRVNQEYPPYTLEKELASAYRQADPDGRWSLTVRVPPNTPPGRQYGVIASCYYDIYGGTPLTTTTVATSTSTAASTSSTTTVPGSSTTSPSSPVVARGTKCFCGFVDYLPVRFTVTEPSQNATPAEPVGGAPTFTG